MINNKFLLSILLILSVGFSLTEVISWTNTGNLIASDLDSGTFIGYQNISKAGTTVSYMSNYDGNITVLYADATIRVYSTNFVLITDITTGISNPRSVIKVSSTRYYVGDGTSTVYEINEQGITNRSKQETGLNNGGHNTEVFQYFNDSLGNEYILSAGTTPTLNAKVYAVNITGGSGFNYYINPTTADNNGGSTIWAHINFTGDASHPRYLILARPLRATIDFITLNNDFNATASYQTKSIPALQSSNWIYYNSLYVNQSNSCYVIQGTQTQTYCIVPNATVGNTEFNANGNFSSFYVQSIPLNLGGAQSSSGIRFEGLESSRSCGFTNGIANMFCSIAGLSCTTGTAVNSTSYLTLSKFNGVMTKTVPASTLVGYLQNHPQDNHLLTFTDYSTLFSSGYIPSYNTGSTGNGIVALSFAYQTFTKSGCLISCTVPTTTIRAGEYRETVIPIAYNLPISFVNVSSVNISFEPFFDNTGIFQFDNFSNATQIEFLSCSQEVNDATTRWEASLVIGYNSTHFLNRTLRCVGNSTKGITQLTTNSPVTNLVVNATTGVNICNGVVNGGGCPESHVAPITVFSGNTFVFKSSVVQVAFLTVRNIQSPNVDAQAGAGFRLANATVRFGYINQGTSVCSVGSLPSGTYGYTCTLPSGYVNDTGATTINGTLVVSPASLNQTVTVQASRIRSLGLNVSIRDKLGNPLIAVSCFSDYLGSTTSDSNGNCAYTNVRANTVENITIQSNNYEQIREGLTIGYQVGDFYNGVTSTGYGDQPSNKCQAFNGIYHYTTNVDSLSPVITFSILAGGSCQGQPVGDAVITIDGNSNLACKTNAKGFCVITLPNIDAVTHTVTISKRPAFNDISGSFLLSDFSSGKVTNNITLALFQTLDVNTLQKIGDTATPFATARIPANTSQISGDINACTLASSIASGTGGGTNGADFWLGFFLQTHNIVLLFLTWVAGTLGLVTLAFIMFSLIAFQLLPLPLQLILLAVIIWYVSKYGIDQIVPRQAQQIIRDRFGGTGG